MHDYPVFVRLEGRLVVIVGGGDVAFRKARGLLDTGCRLRVIAPEFSPDFLAVGETQRQVELVKREYRAGDLARATLAFAATDVREVNAAVVEEASQLGIAVCVVDHPDEGDFIVPAVFRRGPLSFAISTGGASPAIARLVRETLERTFGEEYETLLDLAAGFRQRALNELSDPAVRRSFLLQLADLELLVTIREQGAQGASALLEKRYAEALASQRPG